MNRGEFVKAFYNAAGRALFFSEKARHNGLLSLEDDIDIEKAVDGDVFELGMRYVVDGVNPEEIKKILSILAQQEKDEYVSLLKTIQKEAALAIQSGLNTGLLILMLYSYTDISLSDLKDNGILKRACVFKAR